MSTLFKATQYVPVNIGDAFGGGYFAGYISYTADGNPTHALIVAPRATGATGGAYLGATQAFAANATAPDGVNYSTTATGGSFTGSITGTTMTVTAVASGKIRPGHTITGSSVALNTIVVNQVSGTTNGIGDYTVSVSQTITSRTLTASTSEFNGAANATVFKDIDSSVGSGSTIFPAANFCQALSIGGFTDWYLPSRLEMEITYFNLKFTTGANSTGWGANVYSVPRRPRNYSRNFPLQTKLTNFNTTSQGFAPDNHWSSTEITNGQSFVVALSDGGQGNNPNTLANPVRAFRRIAL